MTPSIADRLASMVTAMNMAVIPALDPADALGQEQAGLIVGHLLLLGAQCDHADRFEQLELRAAGLLARRLVAVASGGPGTMAAASALEHAARIGAPEPRGRDRRDRIEAVNAAIDALLKAADGDEGFADMSRRLVLDFGRAQSALNRSWFALTRFEHASVRLPGIDEAMAIFAAELDLLSA